MPQSARIWQVREDGGLSEVDSTSLGREEQLEDWLEADISILSDRLLVIGRQVATDVSGEIDLLCLNEDGDLVILELKRDKTPRQVVAQTLDYASWVVDLGREEIEDQAESYLEEPLEQVFPARFDRQVPEVIGESHEILIVGASIDAQSERIIDYLSEVHGVNINAATFQYFEDEETGPLLARVFLIDPEKVQTSARRKGTSKRKPKLTREELEAQADEQGVGDWYRSIAGALEAAPFSNPVTTQSSISFYVDLRETEFDVKDGVVFSLRPDPDHWPSRHEDREEGLYFQAYTHRLAVWSGRSEEEILEILPNDRTGWRYASGNGEKEWTGVEGFFREEREVETFIAGIREVAGS